MQNGVRDTTLPKSNGPIEPQLNHKDNHIILTLKRQFIMTKETKENVQIVSAIAMLIGDSSSLSQDSSYRPPDKSTSLSWVYSQSV